MPEVVLLMGLQGAGKSSFYRARFAPTHLHVSKDLWPNIRNKAQRQAQIIRAALEAGESVVVDNTNITRADRTAVISLAQEFGVPVTGYFLSSRLDECLQRNSERTGRARVPDHVLYITQSRLEMPSLDEGFTALSFVQLTSEDTFAIKDRKE